MDTTSDAAHSKSLTLLGAIGCGGYTVHAGYHFLQGTPEHAIWICHFAALVAGIALILRNPRLNAAGLLCLSIGLPMWLLSLAGGEAFIVTSPLTHVLGPILGVLGARAMGFPKYAWVEALAIVGGLMIVARLFTPAASNVNLAFEPMEGLSLWTVGGALSLDLSAGVLGGRVVRPGPALADDSPARPSVAVSVSAFHDVHNQQGGGDAVNQPHHRAAH